MDLIYILDVLFHFRTGYLEVNKKEMKLNGSCINLSFFRGNVDHRALVITTLAQLTMRFVLIEVKVTA